MKTHATRPTIIRGWLAPPTDKRAAEEQMQRIANAFFFGVTIFSIAFAYFVLSAKRKITVCTGTHNSMSSLQASEGVPDDEIVLPQIRLPPDNSPCL